MLKLQAHFLLSNIDKIFQKLMHKRLMTFLDQSGSLYPLQFGFRSKHSTETALQYCVDQISTALDEGEYGCSIFIDLQKAFDTVDHEILISKLDFYGVRGTALSWYRSFLSDRSQFVSISSINSKTKHIPHGVPQGPPKTLFLDHYYFFFMLTIYISHFLTL